jgi:hypothetical protein
MRYLGRIRCSKSDEFDKRKALIKEKTDEFKVQAIAFILGMEAFLVKSFKV